MCTCKAAEPSEDQLVSLVATGASKAVVLREAGDKQIRSLLRVNRQEQWPPAGIPPGSARTNT